MNFLYCCRALAAWRTRRSPSQPAKCWTNSAKKSTAPSKPNIRPALSRISNRELRHETGRLLNHLLRCAVRNLDAACKAEDMASVFIPDPVGRWGVAVLRISGSHVLDRDSRKHAAGAHWLRHFRCAWHDPRAWHRE